MIYYYNHETCNLQKGDGAKGGQNETELDIYYKKQKWNYVASYLNS